MSAHPILIFLISGFIGFFIPFLVISIKDLFNNKIQTAEDLEKIIQAPFLGDVPKTKVKQNFVVKDYAVYEVQRPSTCMVWY